MEAQGVLDPALVGSALAILLFSLFGLPLCALVALWRVRRGVAAAGWSGMALRVIAGAAAIVAAGFALAFAMIPGVEREIAICRIDERPGDFCEDGGVVVGIPPIVGIYLAPLWAGAVIVMKLAILAWRRWKTA
ncbi:MAG: hypothetical protein MI723_10785 [Caulobacterales bacterium]|nr:hypothetical protein [Caulobacterales bacterium]